MSIADNFLQKQQKQRERQLKKGCDGDPLRGSGKGCVGSTAAAQNCVPALNVKMFWVKGRPPVELCWA
jgi:hypothetical protein